MGEGVYIYTGGGLKGVRGCPYPSIPAGFKPQSDLGSGLSGAVNRDILAAINLARSLHKSPLRWPQIAR